MRVVRGTDPRGSGCRCCNVQTFRYVTGCFKVRLCWVLNCWSCSHGIVLLSMSFAGASPGTWVTVRPSRLPVACPSGCAVGVTVPLSGLTSYWRCRTHQCDQSRQPEWCRFWPGNMCGNGYARVVGGPASRRIATRHAQWLLAGERSNASTEGGHASSHFRSIGTVIHKGSREQVRSLPSW